MVERSEIGVRDMLQRLARSWSETEVHPNQVGGVCDVCGKHTPQGEEQFLLIHVGEGDRMSLDRSCYSKWHIERNKWFSA